jgi:DNA-binding transcriptional MerR regulator
VRSYGDGVDQHWKVGELADISGLSVRALHHYDEIGLLRPSSRTAGGHRLYSEADVRRLYQICALRDLGVALDEIAAILDRGEGVVDLLRHHLRQVETQLQDLTLLRARLELACGDDAPAEGSDFIELLRAMALVTTQIRRHADRADAVAASDASWHDLADQLRRHAELGTPATDGDVLVLARIARKKILDFAHGDAEVVRALARMRKASPALDSAGWDKALLAYLDEALDNLEHTGPGASDA